VTSYDSYLFRIFQYTNVFPLYQYPLFFTLSLLLVDPFVIVRCRDEQYKSDVKTDEHQTPNFNWKTMVRGKIHDNVTVAVLQEGGALQSETIIGSVVVAIHDLHDGRVEDGWYRLSFEGKPAGEVRLRMQLMHGGERAIEAMPPPPAAPHPVAAPAPVPAPAPAPAPAPQPQYAPAPAPQPQYAPVPQQPQQQYAPQQPQQQYAPQQPQQQYAPQQPQYAPQQPQYAPQQPQYAPQQPQYAQPQPQYGQPQFMQPTPQPQYGHPAYAQPHPVYAPAPGAPVYVPGMSAPVMAGHPQMVMAGMPIQVQQGVPMMVVPGQPQYMMPGMQPQYPRHF
jgi:hypothetical protein